LVNPSHGHPERRDLGSLKRVIVKLGSTTALRLDLPAFAAEVVAARELGVDIILVSSGAVAVGMETLSLTERPMELARVQALAAIGQADLMHRYKEAFARHGVPCAQILLTHEDLSDRGHFLNIRHTLSEALAWGAVPVANENDTVATEELRFGDNDRLAAALATVVDADLVILLSDVDALYSADPRFDPSAAPIAAVEVVDGAIRAMAGGVGSRVGTGGMRSKIDAARLAVEAGIPLVLASGQAPRALTRILAGEPLGTIFVPPARRVTRRRHWIGHLSKVHGRLQIDAGAALALRERGSSLLPVGVVAVSGRFARGAAVAIDGPDGPVARGLTGYASGDVARIVGLRTSEVEALLELNAVDPVVHRNDLVLVEEEPS
jgi:glutamate 5-kinase